MISFDIRLDSLANEAVSGSGGNSDSLDINNSAGNIFLNVAARAGGTNTMSLVAQHSEDNSAWGTVPASALFNVLTGEAATFDDVTTAATDQTLGLNRQQLKRYVRVAYTGSTLTQNVAVTAAYQPQMTQY